MIKLESIYIGTAGWSYEDWGGIVYPASAPKTFNRLRFLSDFFNVIEINSSFYHPPRLPVVKNWLRQIDHKENFLFSIKLWQRFTHQRESFPASNEIEKVRAGLDLLKDRNRLGALLIQFPWSFKFSESNFSWLKKVAELFQNYVPVIEIRHNSWLKEDFLNFLKENNIGFANIDQPIMDESIPLTSYITGSVAYVRFHGRNAKNWFNENATVASRYDYLYSLDELENIRHQIEGLIEFSSKSIFIFNNHFRGQAVANAIQLQYLFDGKKKAMPDSLAQKYPELRKIQKAAPGQISLFT